jgi:hypothetical protein
VLLEARRGERVVYGAEFETDEASLAGAMRLTFSFANASGATRVTLRHQGLPPPISVGDNQRGSQSSLKNLAGLIEQRG